MRCLYRERITVTGDYKEIDIFPVRKLSNARGAKAHPSKEVQKKLNQKNSARRLTWLIQNNFGANDYAVGLNYPSQLDITPDRAIRLIKNWLRRVKRKFEKQGLEFQYIYSTELGTKNHRPHHHVICSGALGAKILKEEWDKQFESFKTTDRTSFTHYKHLIFTRTGLAELAFYIGKDPSLAYRSYSCSKNLQQPEQTKRDGRISGKKLQELRTDCFNAEEFEKLYPGYEFVDADPYWTVDGNGEVDFFDFPYITIRLFKKDSKYIIRDLDRS